jgi:hypothetical protein
MPVAGIRQKAIECAVTHSIAFFRHSWSRVEKRLGALFEVRAQHPRHLLVLLH